MMILEVVGLLLLCVIISLLRDSTKALKSQTNEVPAQEPPAPAVKDPLDEGFENLMGYSANGQNGFAQEEER